MDETSMPSSSKQTVFGQGGIDGQTYITNTNSTIEFNFQFTENKFVEGVAAAAFASAPPRQIPFRNNENEIDFESRTSVFNEILDEIKDDGFKMIGIWGMPGIGKSTLVEKVAKYAQDEGLFKVVAMAVVSQKSVKDIQGQIADAIGLKLTCESERGRANELDQRLLSMEKILVILDDIWDSSLVLNDIGIPSGSQHKGCKIILTSRKRDVCEEMGTGKNFPINLLSENEALELFVKVSGVGNISSEKGRLAEELSKECGALPLAIVVVAGGLLNKELIHWTDMLTRLRNSDLDSRVLAAIDLSYNMLKREEEKMFFLLCALFPEDYKISVQVLFEYGIGLALFEKVYNLDQALERAHKLASSLKSSCLLLDAGSDLEGKVYVKMHDVVRDGALAIASEGRNAFLVRPEAQWREWQDKTAISLWNDDIIKKLSDAVECFRRLKILILHCSRYPKWQLHDNFFTEMKTLIVLDIEGMNCVPLPQSFACLENLQTLHLCSCELEDISIIEKLRNLVSLSFCGSNIEVLPEEVGNLSNLRLLDLTDCERLKEISPGVIQNLSQLEGLLMIRTPFGPHELKDWRPENAVLSELIHLPHLMILKIHIPDASMLPDDDTLFQKLTKFKISIGDSRVELFYWDLPILQINHISKNELTKAGIKTLMMKAQMLHLEDVSGISSVALPSLQQMRLINLPSLKKISATTVGELIFLTVKHCDKLLEIFPSNLPEGVKKLERLEVKKLERLEVKSCASLERVFGVVKDHPPFFANLQWLILYDLAKLKQLWWNKNTCENFGLPSLMYLTIHTCPALQFVFDPSIGSRMENLRNLNIRNCSSMVEIVAEKPGKKIEFPLLHDLRVINLPCFKVNQSVEFPHAEFVALGRCFNMKNRYDVTVERDGNIQLQGSMSFFESLVEFLKTKTGMGYADDKFTWLLN